MTFSRNAQRRIPNWLLWTFLSTVAAALVTYLLIWYGPDLIGRHDIGDVTGSLRVARLQQARDAARGRLLTLGAGLFAAGALIFTAQNYRVARRSLEVTEQGQVTDRYTKAIEQLGSDKLDIRIGGIHALERIARDSAKDHPTVMEVLCAFIREHSRELWPEAERGSESPLRATRPDVQAALTVLGRRDPGRDVRRLDLSHAALVRADLTDANLVRALLAGADLTGAQLLHANLGGADLTDANLSRATGNVMLAHAWLPRANLAHAMLAAADLSHGHLDGANLHGADLRHANLTGAHLGGAILDGANLTDTDLSGANLTRANLNAAFVRANLSRSDLRGATLGGADLERANLTDADLFGTNLVDAKLLDADFTRANLTGTDLPPHLARADLSDAVRHLYDVPVDGWSRDRTTGRLARADTSAGAAEAK